MGEKKKQEFAAHNPKILTYHNALFIAHFTHILFRYVDFTPMEQIELRIFLHWSILFTSFYYMNLCGKRRGII